VNVNNIYIAASNCQVALAFVNTGSRASAKQMGFKRSAARQSPDWTTSLSARPREGGDSVFAPAPGFPPTRE
jgi:hypothetical protein